MNAGEQEYDWMDPEWYVGQDVEEVNEMWEKDKVAGRWTEGGGRQAAIAERRLGTIWAEEGGTHREAVERQRG